MDLVNYVFGILKETTPMTVTETANLRSEIEEDLNKVVTDPTHENYKDVPKAKILRFFRNPWVRLAMAASFLLVVKRIKDWYNGKFDEHPNEEVQS